MNTSPRKGAGSPPSTRFWRLPQLSWLMAGALIVLAAPLSRARASGPAEVVATIGNHRITEQEVDHLLKPQLAAVQSKLYELKRRAIESIANDYLLAQAAASAHLTTAQYLKREIDGKVAQPTAAQIEQLYEQHKGQINQPLDKVKPLLVSYLRDHQTQQRREQVLARLRKNAALKIRLEPPRFEVAAGGYPWLGPRNAPVTIVEFSDFQCPFCERAERSLQAVRSKYAGKLRLVYRNFPLPIHPNAQKAAEAGWCAAEQNKFWQFHDAMFADQSKLDVSDLKGLAARLGCDTKKFSHCLDQAKYAAAVKKDAAEGERLGVDGTPTFFINGRVLNGAQPPAAFEEVIDDELARATAKVSSRQP